MARGCSEGVAKMMEMAQLEFKGRTGQLESSWSRWNQVELQKLQFNFQKLSHGFKRISTKEQGELVQNIQGLNRGLPKQLSPAQDKVHGKQRDIHSFWLLKLRIAKGHLKGQSQLVHQLDPKRVLERGYSIVRNGKGQVIQSVEQVDSGDKIDLEIQDGTIQGVVNRVEAR